MMLRSTSQKNRSLYGRAVRSQVRGLWSDSIDYLTFVYGLQSAIARGYERAWVEGSKTCGLLKTDRTAEEQSVLDRQIRIADSAIFKFADYISARKKVDGHLLRETGARTEIWAKRYDSVVTLARVTSCSDRKFVWELGATSEHCSDCGRYAGRVHRGSVWRSVGAHPQSRRLACRGFNCLCRLTMTDARATPGRPPRPSG